VVFEHTGNGNPCAFFAGRSVACNCCGLGGTGMRGLCCGLVRLTDVGGRKRGGV
jgi:hypothetical protein